MLLPNVLRKMLARLFSRLPLGGFPVLDPLRRPCPATPRFRPVLEMLELRMMPTVTATYTASSGLFVVDAHSSSTATAMTVTENINSQIILNLTGDTFTLAGDAANNGAFNLSTSGATLTIDTSLIYSPHATLVNFDITQRSNNESLSFGLPSIFSGVSNIKITGTGDAVTFTGINNNVAGNLIDTSGSVTVSGNITVGGSVSLTGLGVGSGSTNNWGVVLGSSVTTGSSGNITITGSGSGSGSGHNYGVSGTLSGTLSAGGSVTITGTGKGTGTRNWGVSLQGAITAGSSVTISGSGSSNGSGQDYGVNDFGAMSAGGSVTITGTGHGTGESNWGVALANSVTSGGSLVITGTGSANGAGNDYGITVAGAVSAGGAVTIIGTGKGTGGDNWGVNLFSSVTAGGSVTLSGTGSGSGSGDGYGVSGSGPLSAGVSVTITGTGAGSGQRNGGVSLGTSVTAGSSGNITITGTGSANSSQYGYGVYIQDAVSAGGNVTITGTGGGMGTENLGVGLASSVTAGSSITIYGTGSATATGNGSGVGISGPVTAGVSITIIGKGQGAGTHDSGVVLFGDVQSGTSGNVTIRGAASASATYDNDGVDIGAGVSAGGGVTITGTGNGMATGIFDGANDGVVISGSTTVVAAVNGALTISGSSGSTGGPFELGVLIENGAQVEVTGTGPLTITGTSGQGPENYASGVEVDSAGTAILGSSGGITIKGTSRSSGTGSRGVSVEFGALIQAASTGAVSLTGQAASSMPAIYFDNGNNSELKVDTGNVTLTGNVIDLGQGNSIFSTTTSGLSHLAFQAYTYGRAIVIGAGSDVPNALTFTTTDIGAIAQGGSNDGFGLITIGSASGGNPMSLGAITTSFKTNLSLQARGGLTMPVITVLPPPGYEPLSVTGTVDLNSDPLYLVAPNSSPGNGFPSNLIHATEGTDGTTFLGQPEGSIVTDSAGNAYTISYQADGNTEVQLLSITLPKPNPPSPGAGTGRGRG